MDKLRELMSKMYSEDLIESRIKAIAGVGGDDEEDGEKAVVD